MSEWRWSGIEPRLDEMLGDPIVRALMLCDGITEQEVLAAMAKASHRQPPPRLVLVPAAAASA